MKQKWIKGITSYVSGSDDPSFPWYYTCNGVSVHTHQEVRTLQDEELSHHVREETSTPA